jgi:hypothetical protein
MYRLCIVLASSENRDLLGRQICPVVVRMVLPLVQIEGRGQAYMFWGRRGLCLLWRSGGSAIRSYFWMDEKVGHWHAHSDFNMDSVENPLFFLVIL